MNLKGEFESLFLTSILQLLCDDRKTGVLLVTSGKKQSRVFFAKGTIVYATGSQKEARLGYILKSNGILSDEQLQKCLESGREKKQALGKILLDKGYISLDALEKYNRKQVEEILYNMLLWKKGKFEYTDTKLNLRGMAVTQLNPMKLILEASRRVDEMSILTEQITSNRLVFKISGKVEKKEGIKLNANEWRILSLIDGSRTVRQVIDKSGYDEFAVYKILYSILSYGLIEKGEEIQLADEESGDDYSSIITVYCDILQAMKKQIAVELGSQTAAVFEECKSGLDTLHQNLFKEFHPDKPTNANIKAISVSMREFDDFEEGHRFLINGFNEYCTRLLNNVADILGITPIQRIMQEVEKVIDYVNKYQTGSHEKSKIVNDIKNILIIVEARLKDSKWEKRGNSGIFSFLKKKQKS
ncbi:MAG: DUF4388 domain-containing protein [Thermodesulfobacteriota bacterium]|nr:DUF4388 domain-containing protein [Thermodesulfobacteriota bacterium]